MEENVQKNGIGTTGLVFSILGTVFCWVPILDFILLGFGFLFSFIGIFKNPKGKAIAGLVISVIVLLALIILVATIGSIADLGLLDGLIDF